MKIVDLLIVLNSDVDVRIRENGEVKYAGTKDDIPYSLILKDIISFDIWIDIDDGVYCPIVVIGI